MRSITKGLVLMGFDIRVSGGPDTLHVVIRHPELGDYRSTDGVGFVVLAVHASGAWREADPAYPIVYPHLVSFNNEV